MPREKHLPKEAPKGGGRAFFVSPKTMELIKKFLGRTDVELDPKQFEMEEKAGVRHYRLKEKQETEGRGGGGSSAVCYFGEEVENAGESGTEAGVRGGTLIAGDQTWNVLPYPFDLSADGEFLIWIEVGVTCNSEDDLPLPGLRPSRLAAGGVLPELRQAVGVQGTELTARSDHEEDIRCLNESDSAERGLGF
jgi:hypothetical protein